MASTIANTRQGPTRRAVAGGYPRAAVLTTSLSGADNDLTYTAASTGPYGNALTVAYVVSGNDTPPSVAVVGTAVTVHVATDSGGAATSTAADVRAAVNGATALLIAADATGNDGSGVVAALSPASLSGGAGWVIGR